MTPREQLGNKWVEIAKLLPGRSENDVKNRAYCEMRKRKRKGAWRGVTLPGMRA